MIDADASTRISRLRLMSLIKAHPDFAKDIGIKAHLAPAPIFRQIGPELNGALAATTVGKERKSARFAVLKRKEEQ
ncbi:MULTISPECIES: hypothetical protein [unclassified Adlercreutzia]|uniref:hypothetical protein n=1 Tax=unclassified Adlercreutzia TaxID=2636013 RepID=UPI0013EA182D|nr:MULTISPECIES: hypothetical protein [unclassified Adlercreutzia]